MTNGLKHFWQELTRRKVIYFLIGYITACFAIIEFLDISSDRFAISDGTFDFIYLLAAIGLPAVIILPWYIFSKHKTKENRDPILKSVKTPHEKSLIGERSGCLGVSRGPTEYNCQN